MRGIRASIVALIAASFPVLHASADAPPPPTGVEAADVPFDSGGSLHPDIVQYVSQRLPWVESRLTDGGR